jgi:quinol monooxygenase YgiN/predicted alpha/beta hydrolase family esterase
MRSHSHARIVLFALIAAGTTGALSMAQEAADGRHADVPAGAYSIVAEVRAKPGKEAALRQATLPLVQLVRNDPKNLVYYLQEDRAIPGRFVFYEVFATREDFEAHNRMPYVLEWLAKLPELAVGGVSVTRMQVLNGDGAAPANAAEQSVSIVLVHGAFVDASGWQAVHNTLTKDGFEVLVVQNPTISLAGDVAATERAIERAKHPVVLVGHSYGGMVITEAGTHPKVQALAYLAAYAPDAGESVATLAKQPTPPNEPRAPLLPPQDGYLVVDPSKFPTAFAADVDPVTTQFMAAAQVPWGLEAVQTAITKVAWRTKPTHYMVTTKDAMIPPTAQRSMAKRTGGRTVEIGSSHAVMLSHSREVAAFIKEAAAKVK